MPLSIALNVRAKQDEAFEYAQAKAGGGAPPYVYTLQAGTLPAGVSLNSSTGLISGTPTVGGTFAGLVVRVTDAASATADLDPFTLQVAVAADYVVTTAAELITAVNAAITAGGGKVIAVADGGATEYGSTIINLTNKDPAAPISIIGANHQGATLPGIDFQGSSKFILKGLKFYRDRVVGSGTAADTSAGVIRVHSTQDIWIDDCEISADPYALADFTGYMTVSNVVGAFIDGEQVETLLAGAPNGGSGYYRSGRPRSSATVFAISGSDGKGNRNGGLFAGTWYDASTPRTLRGKTSSATATIGAIASNINMLVGIAAGTAGTPATGLKVTNCFIHDVKWPIGVSGEDIQVIGNRFEDVGASFGDFNGPISNFVFKDNRCIGVWNIDTDGQPSGTNGPHSSLLGLSQTIYDTQDVNIEGNILLVGRNRLDATGEQGFATGPKMNDIPYTLVGGISGTTLTVTGRPNGLPSDIGAYRVTVGHRITGPGVAPGTVVTARGTGVGWLGTYTVNNSQTVSAGTALIGGATCLRWTIRSNLFDANGSIGFQFSSCKDSEYAYNTLVSSRDTRLLPPLTEAKPALYFNDISTGNSAHHNVVCGFTEGLASNSGFVDSSFRDNSYENIVAPIDALTGPASLESLFDGVGGVAPFSGATLANALIMFKPKAGSRIASGIGHAAHYDFETGIGSYPSFTKPKTNVSTGVSLPAVTFDGSTNYSRYTVVGSENLVDMVDPVTAFTMIMQVRVRNPDNYDATLVQAQNADIYLRRLPTAGAKLTFSAKGETTSAATLDIVSSFGLTAADGLTLVTVSMDLTNYRCQVMKGAILDPFVTIDKWTGEKLKLTDNTLTVMGTYGTTGGDKVNGDIALLYFTPEFIDLTDPDNHDKIVALDGKPVDYGSTGSLVTGTQPKVLLKGVAVDWNAGGGLNLGSAVRKFIKAGADLTNA